MFNLKKYSQVRNEDWLPIWESELKKSVINKIDELKSHGTIGIGFNGFLKVFNPPSGGPVERAPEYAKEQAFERYLEILSNILLHLPEGYYGFVYHNDLHSGTGHQYTLED